MAIKRRVCGAVAGLSLALGVAACTSSSGATVSGSSGATVSGSSGATVSGSGGAASSGVNVAGAQAIVAKYLNPPQSLGLPPLSKKPPTGKYVISL